MLTGPEAIAQLAGGKVLPIYLEGRVVPVQNDISRELGLSANQVVRAVVEQRSEGLIILINGRPVELPTQLRFRPGDLIWLKVVQTPKGLMLQTVAPPSGQAGSGLPGQPLPTGTAAPLPTAAVSPLVASLFAQPANFNGLMSLLSNSGGLASLSTLAQSSGALGPLALFLNARPSMARLSPDGVRAALAASGFLTEARLAAGKSVRADLKAGLREAIQRITASATGSTSSLKSMLESAVRELESSQADALSSSSQREFVFSFLIPFRDAEPVLVTFQKPPRSPDDAESPFIINLHTRSDGLGEVWMKTVVGRKTRLDLTMWADRAETAQRAELAKSELAEELESAGLSLASLTVFHGRRPTDAPALTPDQGHGVVFDQRAWFRTGIRALPSEFLKALGPPAWPMPQRTTKKQLEAVALEYGKNKTPVVVAKGSEELAQLIVEEAERQGVYIAQDPQLLALLAKLELDQEIPEELYVAVAVVLSWAYWLKGMQPGDEK